MHSLQVWRTGGPSVFGLLQFSHERLTFVWFTAWLHTAHACIIGRIAISKKHRVEKKMYEIGVEGQQSTCKWSKWTGRDINSQPVVLSNFSEVVAPMTEVILCHMTLKVIVYEIYFYFTTVMVRCCEHCGYNVVVVVVVVFVCNFIILHRMSVIKFISWRHDGSDISLRCILRSSNCTVVVLCILSFFTCINRAWISRVWVSVTCDKWFNWRLNGSVLQSLLWLSTWRRCLNWSQKVQETVRFIGLVDNLVYILWNCSINHYILWC